MPESKFFLVVLKAALIISFSTASAQKLKLRRGAVIDKTSFADTAGQNKGRLVFVNLNKVAYYHNQQLLAQVQQLDRGKNWAALFPVLQQYVFSFGIQNFYRDTYWVWKLAKLTELYGEMEQAKALYRLVLKHHRSDIDIKKVELYYDSLTTYDKEYYVPIEYYYELVEFRKSIDTLRPPRGVLLNMGEVINSPYPDYGPALGNRNDILFFSSKRNTTKKGIEVIENEDLFFSRNYDGYWDKAESLAGINSGYNEGSACLTDNARTIYFSRCGSPDGFGNCDIYTAELLPDSTWGKVRNLGLNVNSKAWDSQPSLSHTEDTLFFASDRIGGFGLSDIYFTVRDKDGNWSVAQNAGPVVNTRNNEVSPFYHPIYNVLYFSSNGQLLNFGDFDIYKSYLTEGQWEEPKNIGPLVNGKGFEYYFTIDSESTRLFYARSEGPGKQNLDLFSFPLPMEAQPAARTKLTGSLTDSVTGKPLQGIVSIIDLDHGIEVAPKKIKPDGTFEFDLIDRNNYLLIIQGDEFFRIEQVFYLGGDTQIDEKTKALDRKIKFESIEFEEEQWDILPEMYSDLNKVVNFLLDNHDFKLRISGHTDSAGNPDFNMKLSQKRADAIMNFIVVTGSLEDDRVQATGYGSTRPIVSEDTPNARKLNRRVEFEIYREGEQ